MRTIYAEYNINHDSILSCKSLFLCFVFRFFILIGCPVTGFTFFIEHRLFYRYLYDFLMCPGIIPLLC